MNKDKRILHPKRILIINLLILLFSFAAFAQNAWINEIHYLGETNEGIEIVIENSEDYNIADFTIELYELHGSVTSYYSTDLSTFANAGTYNSDMTIFYKFITGIDDGLQNSGKLHDNFSAGIALGYNDSLLHFIT